VGKSFVWSFLNGDGVGFLLSSVGTYSDVWTRHPTGNVYGWVGHTKAVWVYIIC